MTKQYLVALVAGVPSVLGLGGSSAARRPCRRCCRYPCSPPTATLQLSLQVSVNLRCSMCRVSFPPSCPWSRHSPRVPRSPRSGLQRFPVLGIGELAGPVPVVNVRVHLVDVPLHAGLELLVCSHPDESLFRPKSGIVPWYKRPTVYRLQQRRCE